MDTLKDVIKVEVSGTIFPIKRNLIQHHQNSRLGKLLENKEVNCSELCFHRPVKAFKEVLSFYQTGELHMATNMCPKAFLRELEFWGFDQSHLEKCCQFQLLSTLAVQETTNNFHETLLTKRNLDKSESGKVGFRARLWTILDNRERTTLSKAYMALAISFVVLSIISLAISTLPEFNKPLTAAQMKKYIMSKDSNMDEILMDYINSLHPGEYVYFHWKSNHGIYQHLDYQTFIMANNMSQKHDNDTLLQLYQYSKLKLRPFETRHEYFEYIENVVLAFFTIELMARLVACPSVLEYFQSVLNCIDVLVLISTYIYIVIFHLYVHLKYESIVATILLNIQAFRALRIIRIAQNMGVIVVLLHSLRRSLKELSILVLYMLMTVNLFANFLYIAEKHYNIESIPQAWYWGIVTMTTLGYGDVYPSSAIGKVVACMCAICGIVLLALLIPIVVNNFIVLYQVIVLSDRMRTRKEDHEDKELTKHTHGRKAKVSVHPEINVK